MNLVRLLGLGGAQLALPPCTTLRDRRRRLPALLLLHLGDVLPALEHRERDERNREKSERHAPDQVVERAQFPVLEQREEPEEDQPVPGAGDHVVAIVQPRLDLAQHDERAQTPSLTALMANLSMNTRNDA